MSTVNENLPDTGKNALPDTGKNALPDTGKNALPDTGKGLPPFGGPPLRHEYSEAPYSNAVTSFADAVTKS
jgi:hypothetical protein